MERYIRNKWEKKMFMDAPPQPAVAASAKIRPGANIPQRSSSVPQMQRESDMSQSLAVLRDMGFRDDEKNRRVLNQTNGKLEPAVEILSKLPGQPSITIQRKDQMTEQQMLSKLWGLGYKDESKCRDALRRTGGNLDVAIEILAKESRTGTGTPPVPPKNNAPQSLIDVSQNSVNIVQPNMNPYQVQVQQMPAQQQMPVQQMPMQQMPMQQLQMQQLQMQQPQVQTATNPFGASVIGMQCLQT
jgi:UBA/TS-N domain